MTLFVYDELTFGVIIDDHEVGVIETTRSDTFLWQGDDGLKFEEPTLEEMLRSLREEFDTSFG